MQDAVPFFDHSEHTHGRQSEADQKFVEWLRTTPGIKRCPECHRQIGQPHTNYCDRCGIVGSIGCDNPDRAMHP